jgi:hypothetical protein
MVATRPEPYGRSEFDAVGGIKGEPVDVIEGEVTGLPIPAYAEIAVEAEFSHPAVPGISDGLARTIHSHLHLPQEAETG